MQEVNLLALLKVALEAMVEVDTGLADPVGANPGLTILAAVEVVLGILKPVVLAVPVQEAVVLS
jgi:hypothetical protein